MTIICEKCQEKPASYKIKGKENLVSRCTDCRESDMVRGDSRICKHKGCGRGALYNFDGETVPIKCKEHSHPDMDNVRSKKCEYAGCRTRPSYNHVGFREKFCAKHKEDGMVNVRSEKCSKKECFKIRLYGYKGGKPQFCQDHREKNMTNVRSKKCRHEGCETYPLYNYEGQSPPIYCNTHRKKGMVDVKSIMCEYGVCKTRATFNHPHKTRPKFCRDHKKPDMVDVRSKRCAKKGCTKQPFFNFEGLPGLYCASHKKSGMEYTGGNLCKKDGCKKHAAFNYEGLARKYCKDHYKSGMVDVKVTRCEVKGCKTKATQGNLFAPASRCLEHRKKGMVPQRRLKAICEKCPNAAYWCKKGEVYPTRCDDHSSLKTYINVVERECESCLVPCILPKDKEPFLCQVCDPEAEDTKTEHAHAKELRIKKVLETAGFTLLSHDKIPENACSRRRPDFIIDLGPLMIIVEVDEKQHKHLSRACELGRMMEIYQDLGGVPIIFIRYNPDSYVSASGERIKGLKKNLSREKRLVELIHKIKRRYTRKSSSGREPSMPPYLSAYFLFYDGDLHKSKPVILDYEDVNRDELVERLQEPYS